MKSAGELLRTARQERGISLEDAVEATKIKREFLEALERNDFQKVASTAVVVGFLKNYAEFLGLSSQRVLAVFRRDTGRKEKKEIVPRGIRERLEESGFSWNPKAGLILVILIVFLFLAGYLSYQYFSLAVEPGLRVFQPQEGQRIQDKRVEVIGQTDRDVTVRINDRPVFLSPKGDFRFQLDLLSGENKIVIEAANRRGRESKIERTVFVVN